MAKPTTPAEIDLDAQLDEITVASLSALNINFKDAARMQLMHRVMAKKNAAHIRAGEIQHFIGSAESWDKVAHTAYHNARMMLRVARNNERSTAKPAPGQ